MVYNWPPAGLDIESASLPLVYNSVSGALSINTFTGDSGAGGLRGVVPAPAAGDAAANKFLNADGTWTGGVGDILQGGNSFGAPVEIGANDDYSLQLRHKNGPGYLGREHITTLTYATIGGFPTYVLGAGLYPPTASDIDNANLYITANNYSGQWGTIKIIAATPVTNVNDFADSGGGAGGSVYFQAGNGSTLGGDGGLAQLLAGSAIGAGNGGSLQAAAGNGDVGGNATFSSGSGGSGAGGQFSITAGDSVDAAGGLLTTRAGNSTNAAGGNATLFAGHASAGTGGGGYLDLEAGYSTGGTGGEAYLWAGSGVNGGFVDIEAGPGSALGGYVFISSGTSGAGAGGDIRLSLGAGSTVPGEQRLEVNGVTGAFEKKTVGSVSTTDATVTTIQTLPIATDKTVHMQVIVTGRRTGGAAGTTGDGASYNLTARVKNIAGTVTIHDLMSVESEDQAGFNADLAVSGTDILVQVTGAVDNDMDWRAITTQTGEPS